MAVCVTVALVVMGSLAAAHAQQAAREESVFAAMWRAFAVDATGAQTWASRIYEALVTQASAPAEVAPPEAAAPAVAATTQRPAHATTRIEHEDPYAVDEAPAEVVMVAPAPLTLSRTRPALDVEDPYGVANEAVTVMNVQVAVPTPTTRGSARIDDENPYL